MLLLITAKYTHTRTHTPLNAQPWGIGSMNGAEFSQWYLLQPFKEEDLDEVPSRNSGQDCARVLSMGDGCF